MADPRPIAIVKLGGSVITRKREVEKLRPKIVARLASEIASIRSHRLVVLHGAGSFGHPGAVRFGLARPPAADTAPGARVRGAAIVSAEVRRLHLTVLRALVAAGARPWSVPPATLAEQRAGELLRLETGPFAQALEAGFTPVSFGDVVLDREWGSSILSADTLALALIGPLGPARVVFVSDVPGVHPPGPVPKGRRPVVRELTDATLADLSPSAGGPDVTGGIRGKVAVMRAIARRGVDAGLISGLSDGSLVRAVEGATGDGSWARAESAGR